MGTATVVEVRRAALILADEPSQVEIIQGGIIVPLPAENRYLRRTEVEFERLVALAWRVQPVMESAITWMAKAAIELLHARDRCAVAEWNYRQRFSQNRKFKARAGDFLVRLPWSEHKIPYGNGTTSVEAAKEQLRSGPVSLIYIGKELPADVNSVYGSLRWESYCAPASDDTWLAAQSNPGVSLSVFDMINAGVSLYGTEVFAGSWMNGRSSIELGRLSRYQVDLPEVHHTIAWKLGLQPVHWKQQVSGLHRWLCTPFRGEQ